MESRAASASPEPRVLIPLDHGWRFRRDDIPEARQPAFDDVRWPAVTLPHTYNGADGEDGGGYYRGPAWYRRVIELGEPPGDEADVGRRYFLQFDGAALAADVYVNGRLAGRHEGGYARFRFDVTESLHPGRNHVAVRVDNAKAPHIAPLGGDFTVFGGLFRRVFLLATADVHVDTLDYGGPGVYVSTEALAPDAGARLLVTTRVRNDGDAPARIVVRTTLVDAEGSTVARLRTGEQVAPGEVAVISQRARIERPRLWNGTKDPHLYHAVTEVLEPGEDAAVLDRLRTSFGIRTVEIDPRRGLLLNGTPVSAHGVNLFHSGRPGRGLAVTGREIRADMATLDELGVTAVRFVHFQHPQAAYDEADRRGFLVWTEIPLNGAIDHGRDFQENLVRQMRELVRQNYNHPSVAVWGLGNEVYSTAPEVELLLKRLQQEAKQEDPTRPTTYAHCCQADDHPKALVSDVSAFNRYFGWYPDQRGTLGEWARAFHRRFPTRAFAVGEFGAGASIRHQQDPPEQPEPAGGWHPEQYQALLHERSWRQLARLDYLWGKFVWVAFDLASDGRSEGDRSGINDKGLVTYDRAVRKDAFYWYQANWSDLPMLRLTSKRAVLRTTPEVEVKTYTNAQAVLLRVNGREIGTVPATDHIARWSGIRLQPGRNHIEVEAETAGRTLRDDALWEYVVLPADLSEVPQ